MTDSARPTPRHHVLLIGIDAYPNGPLRGCVNDINAVYGLVSKLPWFDQEHLRCLASPREGEACVVASAPATLTSIRGELASLASTRVERGDRVLIYYSGHGTRVVSGGYNRRVSREAIVPVDYDAGADGKRRLLYDVEVNACLRAILARTDDVTLVLDCCNSAGAFRAEFDAALDGTARYLPVADADDPPASVAGDPEEPRGMGAGSVEGCAVIAACLADEQAREQGARGEATHLGVMTRALVARLSKLATAKLATVTWGEIWWPLLAEVTAANPMQHPMLAAGWNRPVFGGSDVPGDRGVGLEALANGAYRVAAGTLAGVSPGAELAVYDVEPRTFPAVGTAADAAARIGSLRVTSAERADSEAVSANGVPFELPAAARARLVAPAEQERLRVHVSPPDPEIIATLTSPRLDVRGSASPDTEAWLTLTQEGTYDLGDDLCSDREGTAVGAIVAGIRGLDAARAALEHYARFRAPLRLARRCTDLGNVLEVRVLDCEGDAAEAAIAADPQDPKLSEMRSDERYDYAVPDGRRCCFRVDNRSSRELSVGLLDCALSGRVQHLGFERIPAGGRHVFWYGGNLRAPFAPNRPSGRAHGLDRLIAIGTTRQDRDFKDFAVAESLEDVLAIFNQVRTRGDERGREMGAAASPMAPPPPPELWTARVISVLIG